MVAVLHPLGAGRQIVVDRAVVLIGRSPECDAIIDVSTKISRVHCALVQVDKQFYLRDLGSTNGIWIGGQRVEKEVLLAPGTKVAIGDVQYQFFDNVQPAAKSVSGQTPAVGRADSPAAGGRAFPVLIDETMPPQDDVYEVVDDVEVVEVGDHIDSLKTIQAVDVDGVDVVEVVDVVDDVDVVEAVEVIDVSPVDARFIDAVEVVDDFDVVEVVDDIDVIDVVEVIDDQPEFRPRPRRPRRLT